MGSKCNVCGRNEAKGVYASSIAPVSLAYCERCLEKGAENYHILVTTAAISKSENPQYKIEESLKNTFSASLEVTGYTNEQFNRDVEIELQKLLCSRG